MKSPSANLHAIGARAEATLARDLRRCHHPQARPVILSTGELVACVCIGCFSPLPADYVERQAEAAHRESYCTHDYEANLRSWNEPYDTLWCTSCGRTRQY